MAKNNRGGRNNNPEGRNQFSSSGWMDSAKDKPFTTAAAAAAAVGAGVFLWSKRNQISDQIGRLSDQITDWADDMRSGSAGDSGREFEMAEGSDETAIGSSRQAMAKNRGANARPRSSASRNARNQSRATGQNMSPQTGEPVTH